MPRTPPPAPKQTAAPAGRFDDDAWRQWPYALWRLGFEQARRNGDAYVRALPLADRHQRELAAFAARQWLEPLAPDNNPFTNPVVLRQTVREGGANLLRGAQAAWEDGLRQWSGLPPAGTDRFRPGHEVAATPGKVVLRNRLAELIQYRPMTARTRPEPIFIVPAWIMKYYILDLSPHNSLIAYLVGQGYTVFCVSWKNPTAADRDLGMDDYLRLGVHEPLAAIEAIVPGAAIHAAGYCLGGTLLAMAASAMARDGDRRLASLSLLAAQTDFSEPGELGLFIDDVQVTLLETQMAALGYFPAQQMSGAFQLLRSQQLVWSRMVSEYLLGQRRPMTDLQAWNADATRMPARMHGQYLRRLFLDNDLAAGRYDIDGRPLRLADLTLPTFCVGTETDHVAPWRSVYKLHDLSPAPLTFVLTSGGHNAGIVSEPGHPRRRFRSLPRPAAAPALAPDDWLAAATPHDGSWWPHWRAWLDALSGDPAKPPALGAARKGYPPLGDAPGTYVMER
ncbi:PHA/PHB synthase family protein [Achromobacter insuavis]|uniref:Poly-beta-hydroxybutyrate polymerase domain-containing protein n=1 Tax=Achromobacter insuavis AXX-A TaxID=1003200 RepID=F7SXD6_9BURK|nr:alpha/beta fold hydrolase [Achromobacter insuavis]EGP47473.1 poly-beta-hydroxybutyrate polymerase domain-containing protein [Achromobacter insuavis AXX-A]